MQSRLESSRFSWHGIGISGGIGAETYELLAYELLARIRVPRYWLYMIGLHQVRKILQLLFVALTCYFSIGSDAVCADQIVVPESTDETVRVGSIECSACLDKAPSAMDVLTGQSNGEVTAGDLWKFFRAQGVTSMDQLTLCLDCDPADLDGPTGLEAIDISAFELKIEDPSNRDVLLTDVNLGSNTLVLNNSAFDSTRPEARLAVSLGYDFMERFSADSREKVSMNIASESSSGFLPRISIESGSTMFSNSNMVTLFAFVAFWTVVFTVVNIVTKPDAATL